MSKSRRRAAAALFSFLLPVGFACSEPPPSTPKTNSELYEALAGKLQDVRDGDEARIVRDMNRLLAKHKPMFRSFFLGVHTVQNPFDAWIVQEIISEVKPDLILETGTYRGGSAVLWAVLLGQLNPKGRVITIDIEDQRSQRAKDLPISRERIDFLLGSSTDPEIVAEAHRRAAGKKVLVLLDSLHSAEHVQAELEAYAPLVATGSYVIVQDTPVGPLAAVEAFVAANPCWEIDRKRERFLLTNTVKGYLRRIC